VNTQLRDAIYSVGYTFDLLRLLVSYVRQEISLHTALEPTFRLRYRLRLNFILFDPFCNYLRILRLTATHAGLSHFTVLYSNISIANIQKYFVMSGISMSMVGAYVYLGKN